MIRALIFDFDGTILDTEAPDYECWQELYAERGCSLSLEEWSKCLGTSYDNFDPFDHLQTLSGVPVDRGDIEEEHRRRFSARVEAQPLSPGIVECIGSAQRLGLDLAVASSSWRGWVTRHLTRHGLLDAFKGIRCREDVERVKPDPALYLAALELLGVAPDEAVAFEDSPNGARAAKAAGIFTIAVPNSVSRTLDLDHADLRLETLAGVDLEELLKSCRRG